MTSTSQQQVIERNEMALREIVRTLERGHGSFTVIFARANYQSVREDIISQLKERSPLSLYSVVLPRETTTIYQVMRRGWETAARQFQTEGMPAPGAVLVEGLENLSDVRGAIATANLMRDEFLRTFKCPLVFWVNDETLKLFLRQGKDFASYATTKRFEIDPQALIASLEKTVGHAFEHVMATGAGRFWTVEPGQYRELAAGRSEVAAAGMELDPALDASIEFFLAQDPTLEADAARTKYEECLGLWQQVKAPEREGCTWFYLNLWWREFAARNRSHYNMAYEEARRCCEQALICFEDAKRLDLVSRFINGLEAVLYRLAKREGESSELWEMLQQVAERGFSLHEAEQNRLRQSYDLGSMAMVALGRKQWDIAYDKSRAALELYLEATGRPHRGQRRPWAEFNPELYEYHEALMRYLVGRSLSGLGRIPEAIAALEKARQVGKADYEPELYIDLLKTLSKLHFREGDYRRAYELKQDYRSTEAEYGFRPFTGARSLRPIRRAANPAWNHSDITVVEQGMRRNLAAGREQDVTALVARISLPQYRLIVVHGESGVGKSSLMRAGLVPRLRSSSMDAKTFVPVLLRRYGNWARDLGVQLCRELERVDPVETVPTTAADILRLLRKNGDRSTVTVLIFDQFEEFFFNNVVVNNAVTAEGTGVREKSFQENRKYLYDFIAKCLELIDVKVVLSLREDYLHYLLELDRVSPLSAIDRDILRRDIRYPLEDFSPDRAKQVIRNLTRRSQFNLSSELIDRLVKDLATDFGEVRPIELQVVGAQLQTDNITELEFYQELGSDPKKMLMSQSLEEVIADCGPKQTKLAWLVLGLLTGENSIRPLKTRIELEQDLVQLGYFSEDDLEKERCESYETLSLVLDILVASGLVFFVPDEPVHCYQLVHDYLVQLIRDRQGSAIERLRDNLSRERLLRRRKELQLTRVLKQRLRWAIAAGVALCGLLTFSSYMAYLNWREASNERYLADSLQVENQAQRQASASIIAAQSGVDLTGDRPPAELPNTLAGDNATGDGAASESTENPDSPPPESELPDGSGEISSVLSREALLENLSKLLDREPLNPNPTLAAQIDITHSATLAQLLDPLVQVPAANAANPNMQTPIQDLAWQPGGERFGLIDATGSAQVYSQDGELLFTLDSVSRGRSLQLLWSPNGEGLLTRHSSGVVVLWDQEGNPQSSLRIPALITSSTAVPWAWTGQQLAIAHPQRRRLWIWDTTVNLDRERSPKSTLQLPAIAHSLAWQPADTEAKTLAIGLANGTIVTTTDQETLNANPWLAGDQPVTALAWLPENLRSDRPQKQRLVSVGSTIILWNGDGKAVHISDWPTAFPRSFPVKGQPPSRQASRPLPQQILRWQPQGSLLALLTSPAENRPQGIGVWQLDPTGDALTWVRSLDYSQGLLSAVTWRSDGSMLLTGDRTGAVRRWPLRRSAQKQLLCDETSHCPQ